MGWRSITCAKLPNFLLIITFTVATACLCSQLYDQDKQQPPLVALPEERQIDCSCNLFEGSWVFDDTGNHPLYNASRCPFVTKDFDCQKNGRSDQQYLNYRWQPSGCDLPRFDGQDFLTRFKGKKILFAGDSLSANQWQSLKCMLHASASRHKSSNFNFQETENLSVFTLQDYDISVQLHRCPFLVDVVNENVGRVLKLDSVEINSKAWMGADLVIFNSWHWWVHTGKIQGWDYIEKEGKLYKDMDRLAAYREAMNTWAKWVDTNVNAQITRVFFQGTSPTHYSGAEWGQPKENCLGQTEPVMGSKYPVGMPPAVEIVKEVLSNMTTKVELLDITLLSQLRKDGHPSKYAIKGTDCSHWCLSGVPDTWNEILYSLILQPSQRAVLQ